MNHEDYQEYISQYVDGELSESLEQKLFQHLGSCRQCRGFLKSSWQIQNDILNAKPRSVAESLHQTPMSRAMSDKEPVPFMAIPERNHGAFANRFSATVLLVFMLMMGGLLFSAKVEVPAPLVESTVPPGISLLDNSVKR